MNMKISGSGNRVVLYVGKTKCGITLCGGPWIKGINPDLIKIRSKRGVFPAIVKNNLLVDNNCDSMIDYFEADSIKLLPGHPLYNQAKARLV